MSVSQFGPTGCLNQHIYNKIGIRSIHPLITQTRKGITNYSTTKEDIQLRSILEIAASQTYIISNKARTTISQNTDSELKDSIFEVDQFLGNMTTQLTSNYIAFGDEMDAELDALKLKIGTYESVKSSFVTDMVTGNFALSEFKPPALVFAENDKLPLTIPEPSETLVSFKLNPVILVSSAPVIVISLG